MINFLFRVSFLIKLAPINFNGISLEKTVDHFNLKNNNDMIKLFNSVRFRTGHKNIQLGRTSMKINEFLG